MDRNTVGGFPSRNEHTPFWCLRWNFKSFSHWRGFPGGTYGKELASQCRRHKGHEFDPWVGKILWRRAWQLTPVFFPGEFHGQRGLVGYSPWGCKELGTAELTQYAHAYCQWRTCLKKQSWHYSFVLKGWLGAGATNPIGWICYTLKSFPLSHFTWRVGTFPCGSLVANTLQSL